MNIVEIGGRVRASRLAHGLTQAQLADRAGVSRTTLAQLELGNLPEIGMTKLQNILAVVDMAIEVQSKSPLAATLKRSLAQLVETRKNDPQRKTRVQEQLLRYRRSHVLAPTGSISDLSPPSLRGPGTAKDLRVSTDSTATPSVTSASKAGRYPPTLDELLEQRANERRDRTRPIRKI